LKGEDEGGTALTGEELNSGSEGGAGGGGSSTSGGGTASL
jgi:hypothetical protein